MFLRKLTGVVVALGAGLASVAPASPAHAEEALPDLRTTVAFSQDTGKVGDAVTVKVTVTNGGTATAKDVAVRREWDEDLTWTSPALGDLPKFDLAPGESKVLTRDGVLPPKAATGGFIQVLYFFAAANTDRNISNNIAYRSMRVPGQLGGFTLHVVDAATDIGVRGVVVEFTEQSNSSGNFSARVTSNAAGDAVLKNAPAGPYRLQVRPPAGWRTAEGSTSEAQFSVESKPGTLTLKLERTGEPAPAATSTGGSAPSATPARSAAVTPSPASSSSSAAGGAGGGDGDLPITGANAAVIGTAGLALLLAGAVALLLTRQRRTRFTSSG